MTKKKRRDKSLMHFYTRKWYRGKYRQAKEQRMYAAQAKRREEIIPTLPSDLRALMSIDLNDAECKSFERNTETGFIKMIVRAGDNVIGYFDLDMQYGNASLVSRNNGIAVLLCRSKDELIACIASANVDPLARRAIRVDSGIHTQVLYDEVDVGEDGRFEHRMLLWPYGELLIRFSGFCLTRTPVSSRDAP